MKTRNRIGMAAAVVLAAATGLAGPARSEVIDHERFAVSYSRDIELCGLAVHIEGEVRGMFHNRVGRDQLDSLFFGHMVERYAETLTNTANGRFFTAGGRRLLQEVQGSRVEGSVFRITELEAGSPLVLRDMDGRVVLRDRGVIRRTYLFDTRGDDVPGGDRLELLAVQVAGPHPDFFLEEDERCALIHELIG